MVGAVGTDANEATALSELRRAGVDLPAVRTVDGPTGLAMVTLAHDGESLIVVIPVADAATDVYAVEAASATITGASVCVR